MRTLTPLLAALLLSSCTVEAKLTLSPGPTRISADLSVPAATRAAWANLRDLDSTLPADPLDPGLLQQGLGRGSEVTTTPRGASVAFEVSDLPKLVPTVTSTANSWEMTLDRASLRRLTSLTSWATSPALDSLLPAGDAKVTERDYRDLLVYLLGPGTTEAAAGALIDASTVQLTVVAPRPILTAEGASTITDRSAVYRWPLVKALALEKPLRVRVTF